MIEKSYTLVTRNDKYLCYLSYEHRNSIFKYCNASSGNGISKFLYL